MRTLFGMAVLVSGIAAASTSPVLACDFAFECGGFNPCQIVSCVSHVCVSSPKDCSDGDACTIDKCNPLGVGCYHEPLCSDPDNLVCNGGSICFVTFPADFGQCFDSVLDCDDHDACTIDSCVEPTGCRHVAVNCNDGDVCTTDSCNTATGCQHTAVDECCHVASDCPADACTDRRCVASACTDGTPRSCDDGDAVTVDTCDPIAGCVHTPDTTTSLPGGGACRTDGDCRAPDDACNAAACDGGGQCGDRAVTGFDRLACICRRADPAECAGATLPDKVVKKRARACLLIGKAAADPGKARKLIGRAARSLKRAQKGLTHAKDLSDACRQAESELLADGQTRAADVHDQL